MELARERLIRRIETNQIRSLAEFTTANLPQPGSTEANQEYGGKNYAEVKKIIQEKYGNLGNEQCVALAKAYVGSTASVRDWRRGVNALDGNLQPGTPIATFMDRQGNASTLYDGGVGVGAPKNQKIGRAHV